MLMAKNNSLNTVLVFVLSTLILVVIIGTTDYFISGFLKRVIIVNSSNSYLFQQNFFEHIKVMAFFSIFLALIFACFAKAMGNRLLIYKCITSALVMICIIIIFSFLTFKVNFNDMYVIKNIVTLIIGGFLFPIIIHFVNHLFYKKGI